MKGRLGLSEDAVWEQKLNVASERISRYFSGEMEVYRGKDESLI